jgi:hypothetical protein
MTAEPLAIIANATTTPTRERLRDSELRDFACDRMDQSPSGSASTVRAPPLSI